MAVATVPRNFRRMRESAKGAYDAITLGQLLRRTRPDPESLLTNSRWMQEQLPIRFGRRIEDYLQLPYVVVSNPQFNSVLQTYVDTYDAITAFREINTAEDVKEFQELITSHMGKHSDGTKLIADGYRQVRSLFPHIRLDDFLHTFFTSRIAIRILMESYSKQHEPREGFSSVVGTNMSPLQITQKLATHLTDLTYQIYGITPEVEYRGNLDCTLDYIPRHVSYMIQEVLKNALRATVERHQMQTGGSVFGRQDIPPVIVELQKGDVHVIIKISDQGGGMTKAMQQEAWQYGWTTVNGGAKSVAAASYHGSKDSTLKNELAGFGFGLPLTRLHAQYFGGDVFMQVLPGHGTDMYLVLTHLIEGSPSTEVDDLASSLEKSRIA